MKTILAFTVFAITLVSCESREAHTGESGGADSLKAAITERVSPGFGLGDQFAAVRRALDSISVAEKLIRMKTATKKVIENEMIRDVNPDILFVNVLIERQRNRIFQLNTRLRNQSQRNESLKDSVEQLNYLLSGKQRELEDLNAALASLHSDIANLQTAMIFLMIQNNLKDELIDGAIEYSQLVYYITGTSKELQNARVIDTKGGLLGIGKTSVVSGESDLSVFTPINSAESRSIPVNSKSVKIVSSHPAASFRLARENGQIKSLEITDPEAFWQLTKYLVIVKGS
jgi:predicted RNase H-like nuclease (RuvC/YqgF family)